MKFFEALKKHKRIVVIEQKSLDEYDTDWDSFNKFLPEIEKSENFKSDKMVDGFEEIIWETEIEGIKIRNTTTYGMGAITEVEII
jgi:hypothetical protein